MVSSPPIKSVDKFTSICNTDPGKNGGLGIYDWSELALVQDLFTLNILLVSTIALGWLSLVLDVITAAVKNWCRSRNNNTEDQETRGFWDNAILLEGVKYLVQKPENVITISSHSQQAEEEEETIFLE